MKGMKTITRFVLLVSSLLLILFAGRNCPIGLNSQNLVEEHPKYNISNSLFAEEHPKYNISNGLLAEEHPKYDILYSVLV